jgi:serine/threonine protein kinase
MDQYIGKMLDNRYEILECIGTGGMAVVYKARCHRLNRLVAVKILKPELASDADFRRRFHDESQAVAMLSNANIVSVYDVSHSDGLDYIVMELVDGMTLKQYMQKRGTPLNWREALHFITQIVRALSHAHSRGIIHRDIKPHNIMVLRDGSVKVTDFGIAQLASSAQNTLTQEAIGSVHYISPEQAKGSHVDCRTDIYSAGVVLYEMLTGRLPFEGDTPVFVAIQHINSIPVPPRSLNPEIPKALEDITMKAMAPDLAQRYGSADEMLEDLKEFRKNPNMEVSQPNETDEPTMIVPAIHSISQAERPHRTREQAPSDRRERRREEPEDDYDDEPPRRGGGVLPGLIAILVILLFICGMVYFLYNFLLKGMFSEVQEYSVPSLLGKTLEEIENDKSILGDFTLENGGTVYNAEYPEGQICAQTPDANTKVREGEKTITVNISGGEDKMYMPRVEGWDARQALQKLQNEMGLKVIQEYAPSDDITKGYIISYTPFEGTLVGKGYQEEVTIVISSGPESVPVMVPRFINVNFDQVQSQLDSLGLKMGKVERYHNDEYAEGRVFWQSVNERTEVEQGTTIDFWVSLGPEEPPEPTPSDEPVVTDPPLQSEDPSVVATQDVSVPTSTQTISVDLSRYVGSVNVRIVVGDVTLYDGAVEASTGVLSRQINASGLQMVYIYINEILERSYPLQF